MRISAEGAAGYNHRSSAALNFESEMCEDFYSALLTHWPIVFDLSMETETVQLSEC